MNTIIIHFKYKLHQWYLVKRGYLAEDYEPMKCTKCRSKRFKEHSRYYDEFGVVEYQLRCKGCGWNLAIWSYGNWELL